MIHLYDDFNNSFDFINSLHSKLNSNALLLIVGIARLSEQTGGQRRL